MLLGVLAVSLRQSLVHACFRHHCPLNRWMSYITLTFIISMEKFPTFVHN